MRKTYMAKNQKLRCDSDAIKEIILNIRLDQRFRGISNRERYCRFE